MKILKNLFVLGRTVFVVTFSNFPLFFISKIQTDISLSNIYSEYVELSNYVIDLLILRIIIKEVIDNLVIDIDNM